MSAKTSLFGILLGVAFLALTLRNIDLARLLVSLSSVNYALVLLAACVTFCGYLVRTARWQKLLSPTRVIAGRELFPILVIGFMANNVLPARAGEFVRVYILQRRTDIKKSLGLSTIILERLLDGLTLVLFAGLVSLRFPLPDSGALVARLAGVIFVCAAVAVGLLLVYADFAGKLLLFAVRILPARLAQRSVTMFESMVLGLQAVRRRRTMMAVAILSIGVWLAEALSYLLVMDSFDLRLGQTTPLAALFLLVVVNLAIMLPSAPGYVGTFQAAAVFALGAFGVQAEPALGVAIVSHGMQYALITGLGFLFLSRSGLRLKSASSEEVLTR